MTASSASATSRDAAWRSAWPDSTGVGVSSLMLLSRNGFATRSRRRRVDRPAWLVRSTKCPILGPSGRAIASVHVHSYWPNGASVSCAAEVRAHHDDPGQVRARGSLSPRPDGAHRVTSPLARACLGALLNDCCRSGGVWRVGAPGLQQGLFHPEPRSRGANARRCSESGLRAPTASICGGPWQRRVGPGAAHRCRRVQLPVRGPEAPPPEPQTAGARIHLGGPGADTGTVTARRVDPVPRDRRFLSTATPPGAGWESVLLGPLAGRECSVTTI